MLKNTDLRKFQLIGSSFEILLRTLKLLYHRFLQKKQIMPEIYANTAKIELKCLQFYLPFQVS